MRCFRNDGKSCFTFVVFSFTTFDKKRRREGSAVFSSFFLSLFFFPTLFRFQSIINIYIYIYIEEKEEKKRRIIFSIPDFR